MNKSRVRIIIYIQKDILYLGEFLMSDDSKTILIVDDDELLRDFYTRILKSKGYNVICAENGDDAITILDGDHDVSLVIADLLMPVRTGWELIEYMKNTESLKDIHVIAITGLATSIEEFERVKSTCAAVLQKGNFELGEFTAIIEDIL